MSQNVAKWYTVQCITCRIHAKTQANLHINVFKSYPYSAAQGVQMCFLLSPPAWFPRFAPGLIAFSESHYVDSITRSCGFCEILLRRHYHLAAKIDSPLFIPTPTIHNPNSGAALAVTCISLHQLTYNFCLLLNYLSFVCTRLCLLFLHSTCTVSTAITNTAAKIMKDGGRKGTRRNSPCVEKLA